ncbi:methionyl-tRNA formyltransferase [Aliikangiella sp. IMCC44632]
MKIVFAGTPDFAASALQALLDAGHQICAVYCQPDRPKGRGKKLQPGPVKQLALAQQIPVEQPLNFKSQESVAQLASYQPDLMIVVAYGLLLPESVLKVPRFGCINIHGSLLPRWRGAAPIQRAIESGDNETGITIMQMDKGLDTGDMLLKLSCPITATETGSSLHDKLALLGGKAINQLLAEKQPPYSGEAQDNSLANYAHKLSKHEAEIDWQASAQNIHRKIRAFNAWPVSYSYVGDKRIRIWQAELLEVSTKEIQPGKIVATQKQGIDVVCGDRCLIRITMLQPDGARAMSAADFLNSRQDWLIQNPQLGSLTSSASDCHE